MKYMMDEEVTLDRPGVKTKIIGFILMALGVLNNLLTFHGGEPNEGYFLLIAFGAVVFAIGAVRGGRQSTEVGGKEHDSGN